MRLEKREAPEIVGIDNAEDIVVSDMNGKAFEVMVTGLYSDPIGSMTRELSSNAGDSHKEAGTERPFEITLPTAFNPVFIVEDFGIGMSEETIKEIYSQITRSTKEDSNDVLGRWGLGSKTPLAYTDSFTLISTYEGIRTHYIVYRSDGALKISRASVEAVDECNGVKVIVPVSNKEDYASFDQAVKKQLQFFDTPFKINGEVVDLDPFKDKDFLEIGDMKASSSGRTFYIVQGGVGYPVDAEELARKIKNTGNDAIAKMVSYFGVSYLVSVTVPIGAVDIPPNRESISLKPESVANIVKVLEKSYAEAIALGKEILEDGSMPLYKRVQTFAKHPFLSKVIDTSDLNFTKDDLTETIEDLNFTVRFRMYERGSYGGRSVVRLTEYQDIDLFNVWSSVGIMLKDVKSRFLQRYEQLFERDDNEIYCYAELEFLGEDEELEESLKKVSEVLGGAEIKRLSDIELPKIVKEKKVSVRNLLKIPCRYKLLDENYFSFGSISVTHFTNWGYYREKFYNKTTGVAIKVFNGKDVVEDREEFNKFKNLVSVIKSLNLKTDLKVFLVNQENFKKIKKVSPRIMTIKKFNKIFSNIVEKIIKQYDTKAKILARYHYYTYRKSTVYDSMPLRRSIDKDSVFYTIGTEIQKVIRDYQAVKNDPDFYKANSLFQENYNNSETQYYLTPKQLELEEKLEKDTARITLDAIGHYTWRQERFNENAIKIINALSTKI